MRSTDRSFLLPDSFGHLPAQFRMHFTDLRQCLAALGRDRQRPRPVRGSLVGIRRFQSAVFPQTVQQWIQCARADPVAVFPQLLQHPVSDDRMLIGVLQNVNLPKRACDIPEIVIEIHKPEPLKSRVALSRNCLYSCCSAMSLVLGEANYIRNAAGNAAPPDSGCAYLSLGWAKTACRSRNPRFGSASKPPAGKPPTRGLHPP